MIIVRHGQTELNVKQGFQGHTDYPLTTEGIAQVERNIERLKAFDFRRIICSDLKRARETAAMIAFAFDVPVSEDEKLREVYFGFWDGMTDSEIKQKYPDMWVNRCANKWSFNEYVGVKMKIRAMKADDVAEVALIHAEAFKRQKLSETWIKASFQAYPKSLCFVSDNGVIEGYIIWTIKSGFRDETVLELEQLTVLSAYQKKVLLHN